jgi:hypothetical protein
MLVLASKVAKWQVFCTDWTPYTGWMLPTSVATNLGRKQLNESYPL